MIDQYIHKYGKRLYGLCVTLCASSLEADDLYQETWLKVIKNFSQYDPEKEFEPWLTKICVNTYRNALRRVLHSPIMDLFTNSQEKDAFLESVHAPETPDYSDLHDAIDRLPQKLRIVVILFYFQDMDISSVAQILDIPPGTVKSRLNKARQKLKEVLSSEADLQF